MMVTAVAVGIGLFLVFCGLAMPPRPAAASVVDERINYYGVPLVANPDDELQGSLLDRIGRPQMERLRLAVARWTPSGHYDQLTRDLALAGHPLGLTATDLVVVRIAAAVVALAAAAALGFVTGNLTLGLLAALLLPLLALIGSEVWLRSAVQARQQEIRDALPAAIEFMVVAMPAGLSFDGALNRVIDKYHNPLTAELAKAQAEVDLGRPRQEALEAFARRVAIDELSLFVQTVVSSGQMGTPLGESLRLQAEQLRWRRRGRARTRGAQAPIKMTIPMVLFIFPTLWIVLLGPSVLTLMTHGL
ncbi:MAG: type II secretion system F family protein [Chloroflexota bacterium]